MKHVASRLLLVMTMLLGLGGEVRGQSHVSMLNTDDGPAELLDAQLIRNAVGAPEAVRVTVRNRAQEPLTFVSLAALVFNEKGALRLLAFSGGPIMTPGQQATLPGGPIPSLALRVADIQVHHVEARPGWSVVVAVKAADTARQVWRADNERLKAGAASIVSRSLQ